MEVLAWVLGLVGFLVFLTVSVGLHEFGHKTAAKMVSTEKNPLSVPKFFIGFGPKIWSKTNASGEETGFRAIPLGGYVNIVDESVEEGNPEREALSRVAPWRRIIIFMAGPMVNIVLGLIILIPLLMLTPSYRVSNTIMSVNECGAAAQEDGNGSEVVCNARLAGLEEGDKILAVNGEEQEAFGSALSEKLTSLDSAELLIERDGDEMTVTVPLTNGFMGIVMKPEQYKMGFGETMSTINSTIVANVQAIAELPGRIPSLMADTFTSDERDAEDPGSIIMAGKLYGDTAAATEETKISRVQTLLLYSGVLNIGLGIVNLIPFIAPLDGGRITLAVGDSIKMGWAKIRRKEYHPISMSTVNGLMISTGIFIFAVMGALMLADIVGIARGLI